MQISKPNKVEDIRIQHFVIEQTGVKLNDFTISIPFQTSTFAIAAMLKGLEEFYYKPSDMKLEDTDLAKATEHNLELWLEINGKSKKSNLILE